MTITADCAHDIYPTIIMITMIITVTMIIVLILSEAVVNAELTIVCAPHACVGRVC